MIYDTANGFIETLNVYEYDVYLYKKTGGHIIVNRPEVLLYNQQMYVCRIRIPRNRRPTG